MSSSYRWTVLGLGFRVCFYVFTRASLFVFGLVFMFCVFRVCCLVVGTSSVNCLERVVSEMTNYVSSGTSNCSLTSAALSGVLGVPRHPGRSFRGPQLVGVESFYVLVTHTPLSTIFEVKTVHHCKKCNLRRIERCYIHCVDGSWTREMTSVRSVWLRWEMSGPCIDATPSWTAPKPVQRYSYATIQPCNALGIVAPVYVFLCQYFTDKLSHMFVPCNREYELCHVLTLDGWLLHLVLQGRV